MITKELFISYGRRESLGFVGRLHQQLKLAGYDAWFDKVNIPDGEDYAARIRHGIETAHNFAYVMAPRCLTSPYCLIELEYARILGKRVIPLNQMVIFQTNSHELSESDQTVLHYFYMAHGVPDQRITNTQQVLDRSLTLIGRTDWLDAKEQLSEEDSVKLATWAQHYENHWYQHDEIEYLKCFEFPVFGQNIDSLSSVVERIKLVLERHAPYVQKHTEILIETLIWQRNQRATHFLLIGKERLQAESWLLTEFVEGEQAPCFPTDAQCELICESRKNSYNMMCHAFVCYDITDQSVRDKVVRVLTRHAITTWQHEHDIQQGTDFARAIEHGIETADNFLYFISPASVRSESCQKELAHALQYHKRIIPLRITPTPEEDLSASIRVLQSLDFTQGMNIDPLLNILRHDASYYEQHKILLARALKWQREHKKTTFLLRGHNLNNALVWLRLNQNRVEHPPTESHHALITESEAAKGQLGTEVFISYSRKDGDFARQLNLALQEAGKTTWFDQESISSGVDFEREIFKGIEGADCFIFILSPDAVASPYCEREVHYASTQCKRFIPILWRTIDPAQIPAPLRIMNWIDFQTLPFDKVFPELIQTIDLDREHAHQHTVLQQRASDWVENNRSEDFLLNNTACESAERWQDRAQTENKQPTPTPLQQEFIQESRQAIEAAQRKERRQQNIVLASVTSGAIIAVVLSIFSWMKMEEAELAQAKAEHQKNEALKTQSMFLANLSDRQTDEGSTTHGMLLALEGLPKNHERPYMAEIEDKLYKAVMNTERKMSEKFILLGSSGVGWSPNGECLVTIEKKNVYLWTHQGQLLHMLIGHGNEIQNAVFSPNGQLLATASKDHTARLWAVEHGKLLHVLSGHESGVHQAIFSPEGQILATLSEDHTARLWAVDSGKLLYVLSGHESKLNRAVFSPEGQILATVSEDKTARLWAVEHGELLHTLSGHEGPVWDAKFSPDGRILATVSEDKTARLWAVDSGKLLHTLSGHEDSVVTATFSPKGQTLITLLKDHTARLWAVESGKLLRTLSGYEEGIVNAALSPEGQTLATVSEDHLVRLWAVDSNRLLHTLTGHEGKVSDVAFSPKGRTLAVVSEDHTARLWTVNSSTLLHVLSSHEGKVSNAAFSPDGRILATASSDKTVRLWVVDRGELLHTLRGHEKGILNAVFSPNGQILVTASGDKTARLWAVDSGELLHTLSGHDKEVMSAAFHPNGQILATASGDKTIRLWAVDRGQVLHTLRGHEEGVRHVVFSPDGQTLATVSDDKTARLWAVDRGKLLYTLKGHESYVWSATFSPNGRTLATASWDNTVRLWAVDQGKLLHTLSGHKSFVWSALFSPDGRTLATASLDKTARLWAVDQGTLLHTLSGHEEGVRNIAFSPNSQTLATVSDDKTMRLWAVDQGKLLYTLSGHEKKVMSVAFSPDGQTLATASWDHTARLWKLFKSTQELINYANQLVPRCLSKTQREKFFLPPSEMDHLLEKGEQLAKGGDISAAIKHFKQAQALASCLKFDPDAKAKQLAAQAHLDQGETLAVVGQIPAAVTQFQQALAIDSRFKLDNPEPYAQSLRAMSLIEKLDTMETWIKKEGEIEILINAFQELQQLNTEIKTSAEQWNRLCWYGSLYGQAAKVIEVCEKAVALASPEEEWKSRDKRALARALTGHIQEAIEDFQVAIENAEEKEFKKERRAWIEALQRGEKPFTEEMLKTLRP